MTRKKTDGQQTNIIESLDITADLEVEWTMTNKPEVDSVYMLLVNRTNMNGSVISTIDRINITYYIDRAAIEEIELRLWEEFVRQGNQHHSRAAERRDCNE